jgi:ABC-type antimicrobial peptide transport system permease subunit
VFGVRLLAGRLFDAHDSPTTQRVALLTESAARQLFGASSPLGRRLVPSGAEIVGVIADVRYEPQRQQLPIVGDVYLNLRQLNLRQRFQAGGYITLRTTADPRGYAATLRKIVTELEPRAPIFDAKTMDEHLEGVRSSARFLAVVLVLLAGLALALAVVGIYGTLSYAVAARGREIAIRMALGADRNEVVGLVLRDGLTVCAVGLVVGVPLALASTRVMGALLYEVSPGDPLAFAIAVAVMSATAMLACVIPAYRAAGASPVVVLRR